MTGVVREMFGILLDAVIGSRCVLCRQRSRNLAAHYHWDHAGEA